MVSIDKTAVDAATEPAKEEAKKAAASGPFDGVGEFLAGVVEVVGGIAEGIGDAISGFDLDL
ncbi:hypothetical protein [Curtobacterium sp. MCSS17_016]|uniref:hypothetical protein n=1 Tax=Curtobacterium sp. MCSS17_016 TaxID=2175644 RepID=UPI000DA92E66|nr:hypothetical protein [Curtobacterium sp. MCSS17_016]WIE81278.1 hypothetical protein DEJ19_018770 [Curtobacterium sp. MCSS17_016]